MRLLPMWLAVIFVLLPVSLAQTLLNPGTRALFRISCGATSSFTDAFGNVWAADNFFANTGTRTNVDRSSSTIANIDNAAVATTDQQLYKRERWGPIQYRFNLPNPGIYTVHLHFAEIWPGTFTPGSRQFRVVVEGQNPFGTIDLAASPGPLTAVVKAVAVSVTDGQLNINFQQVIENPKVSGIVVFAPTAAPPPPPPPPPPGTPPTFSTTPRTTRPLLNRPWTYNVQASSGSTLTNPVKPSAGTTTFNLGATSNVATLTFTPALSQAGTSASFTIRATSGSQTTDQSFTLTVDNAFYRVNCGGPQFVESTGITWLSDDASTLNPFSNTGNFFADLTATINQAADTSIPNDILQSHRWDPNDGAANEMVYTFPVPNGAYNLDLIVAEIWTGAQTAGVRIYSATVENNIPFVTNLDETAVAGFRTLLIRTILVQVTDGALNVKFIHNTENPAINALRVRPGTTPSCPAGQTVCGSDCCSGGQTCTSGACVCPTGQSFCSGSCVPTPCGGCGGPTCTGNQVCQNGACVSPPACSAPFVSSGSDCVYPTTGGSCSRDEVDCALGCASAATTSNPMQICTGGQCKNGVCVPHTVTTSDITMLTAAITTFFNAQSQAELNAFNANPTGNVRKGDMVGALIRAMFHDFGPVRAAKGCIYVRDVNTDTCPSSGGGGGPCEFLSTDHNTGLQASTILWHNMYINTKLSNGNTIISTMSLQDFHYLAGAVALKIASGNSALLNIGYKWGRQPCGCLNIRPYIACGRTINGVSFPAPPNTVGTMPGAEDSFTSLTTTMETNMGFTRREWNCLLGAHTLGRCEAANTGYARNWVATNNVFNNQYYIDMLGIIWRREAGTQLSPFSNPDLPANGKNQFHVDGAATHAGDVMLNADMNMFWTLETNPGCDVTHAGGGCPQRLANNEFQTLNDMQDLGTFYACFAPAFQKLSERGNVGLQSPA